MSLKYTLIGLAFLIWPFVLSGQQSDADSLFNLLEKDNPDTGKVIHLNALGRELMFNYPDTAIVLGSEALVLAKKLQWQKGIAITLHNLGTYYYLIGENLKALDFYTEALRIKEVLGDKAEISKTLNNIGLVNYNYGEYPKALDYYFRTLKIDEELGDQIGIAATLGNIGNIYEKQKDYTKALNYYFKALKIAEELGEKSNIASAYTSIGIIYHDKGEYSNALEYYSKSADISKEIGNKNMLARNLGNIGVVYFEQGDFSKALNFAFDAIKLAQELGDQNLIATEFISIGDIYFEAGKFTEAGKYYNKSLEISNDIGALELSISIEKSLVNLYDATGKYHLAFKHLLNLMALKDSVFNEEKHKEITRKEMNYEFEKKEAATKAEQDKKEIIAKAELKRKEQERNYFILGFVILAFFGVFIYRAYREKKKANGIILKQKSEVELQKRIIEEKNKSILDSITYAKRIQQAKLPRKEDINSSLPESFVLFKPKDIVSGDFYFFYRNSQTVFIAVADCTGHGVPGALMSMIGSEQLNEAVLQSSDTSLILKLLNNGIKASLKQSGDEESTRDGMDIAFCSINKENLIVNYAGANRPFWFIRKGQNELEEIIATKKAIGGLTDDNQEFPSHEIKFRQGDTFYICSDGYADQFGGQTGKKLMTKKLKDILLAIQGNSMQEQEKLLDDFIEKWKEGTEQIDDILVIGVRL